MYLGTKEDKRGKYNMINSCLDYIFTVDEYPVYCDGIEIARFRLPTQKDIYAINSSMFGIFNEGIITSTSLMGKELALVLTSWVFDRDINEHNILNLHPKFLNPIITLYTKVKYEYEQNYSSYYGNIKEYILLMENKSNHKHLSKIMRSEPFIGKICPNCRQFARCTRKQELPKILEVSKRVVSYAYRHINKQYDYIIYNKSYEEQPIWFINFLNYALTEIVRVQETNNNNTKQ